MESLSLHAHFADVNKTLAFSAWGQGSGVKGQAAINLAQGILFGRTTFSVPLLLGKERVFGKEKKKICLLLSWVLFWWLFRANLLACKSS